MQLLLVARQLRELALAFLFGHPLQLSLARIDRFLALGEITNAVGRLLVLLRRSFLDLRALLVVGALLPLQLFIEQRRQVLRLTVAAAAAGVAVLLLGDLAAPYFRLCLQQTVERRHLVGDRLTGTIGRELLNRLRHRGDRGRDRVVARGGLRRADDLLREKSGAARPAGPKCTLRPGLQLCLRLRDGLDVSRRTSTTRPALDVPGRADDLLLRRDERVQLLIGSAGARIRLALRSHELLVERTHFEKEEIASRFR